MMSKAKGSAAKLQVAANGNLKRKHCHGDTIPHTGLYSVTHSQHRLPLEVTLRKGETFPHCDACQAPVHFILIKAAPAETDDKAFKVVLHSLPVLDEAENSGAVAV